MNNQSVNFSYNSGTGRLFNIGYNFVRDGDIVNSHDLSASTDNLSLINLAAALPITAHWSALGDWNYNITHDHPQTYFYGAQYNSCCWAIRFLISRTMLSEDSHGNAKFDRDYYVQFQLKGLGNFGRNDPSTLINSVLPAYRDQFTR
jgi:LPS-assembly protein